MVGGLAYDKLCDPLSLMILLTVFPVEDGKGEKQVLCQDAVQGSAGKSPQILNICIT
jgi:hypothetical protein